MENVKDKKKTSFKEKLGEVKDKVLGLGASAVGGLLKGIATIKFVALPGIITDVIIGDDGDSEILPDFVNKHQQGIFVAKHTLFGMSIAPLIVLTYATGTANPNHVNDLSSIYANADAQITEVIESKAEDAGFKGADVFTCNINKEDGKFTSLLTFDKEVKDGVETTLVQFSCNVTPKIAKDYIDLYEIVVDEVGNNNSIIDLQQESTTKKFEESAITLDKSIIKGGSSEFDAYKVKFDQAKDTFIEELDSNIQVYNFEEIGNAYSIFSTFNTQLGFSANDNSGFVPTEIEMNQLDENFGQIKVSGIQTVEGKVDAKKYGFLVESTENEDLMTNFCHKGSIGVVGIQESNKVYSRSIENDGMSK